MIFPIYAEIAEACFGTHSLTRSGRCSLFLGAILVTANSSIILAVFRQRPVISLFSGDLLHHMTEIKSDAAILTWDEWLL